MISTEQNLYDTALARLGLDNEGSYIVELIFTLREKRLTQHLLSTSERREYDLLCASARNSLESLLESHYCKSLELLLNHDSSESPITPELQYAFSVEITAPKVRTKISKSKNGLQLYM